MAAAAFVGPDGKKYVNQLDFLINNSPELKAAGYQNAPTDTAKSFSWGNTGSGATGTKANPIWYIVGALAAIVVIVLIFKKLK